MGNLAEDGRSLTSRAGGPVGRRGRVGCGGGGGGVRKVVKQGGIRVVCRGGGGRCRRGRRRVATGKVEVAPTGKLPMMVTPMVTMVAASVSVAVRQGGGVPVVDDGVHGHSDFTPLLRQPPSRMFE